MVYFTDKARLPFIVYTAVVDFILFNGFLGLFLAAILLGRSGLGYCYKTVCVLAWISFLVSSLMEVTLVCVLSHIQMSLHSQWGHIQDPRPTEEITYPRAFIFPLHQRQSRGMRPGLDATSGTVHNSTEGVRYPYTEQPLPRRPDAMHLSQATTIAEILEESVDAPSENRQDTA
ncbi:hypothetical protein BDZ91DRAFT_800545 [Kalaharituber pfeilii]|nr:hypothetical protein BDZ91DRAFT_800545 [Kalaharituber pfeilii]